MHTLLKNLWCLCSNVYRSCINLRISCWLTPEAFCFWLVQLKLNSPLCLVITKNQHPASVVLLDFAPFLFKVCQHSSWNPGLCKPCRLVIFKLHSVYMLRCLTAFLTSFDIKYMRNESRCLCDIFHNHTILFPWVFQLKWTYKFTQKRVEIHDMLIIR